MKHSYNCSVNDPNFKIHLPLLAELYMRFLYFIHHPLGTVYDSSYKTTERSVEIPLALDFITHALKGEDFLELGCVLPYYIFTEPDHKIYDLADTHPDSEKKDIRFLSKKELSSNIVSISTVEHISQDEYGIPQNSISALDVVNNITNNSKKFFISFPLGSNKVLDDYFLNVDSPYATFITRSKTTLLDWEVCERESLTKEQTCYGSFHAANTICVLTNYKD